MLNLFALSSRKTRERVRQAGGRYTRLRKAPPCCVARGRQNVSLLWRSASGADQLDQSLCAVEFRLSYLPLANSLLKNVRLVSSWRLRDHRHKTARQGSPKLFVARQQVYNAEMDIARLSLACLVVQFGFFVTERPTREVDHRLLSDAEREGKFGDPLPVMTGAMAFSVSRQNDDSMKRSFLVRTVFEMCGHSRPCFLFGVSHESREHPPSLSKEPPSSLKKCFFWTPEHLYRVPQFGRLAFYG